jgi:hypothetical protein
MAAITIKNRAERGQTVDAAVDAYLDWRDDCVLLEAAYCAWTDADRADRALTFDIYQRALDREECTANAYAELIRSVGHPVEPGPALQMAGIRPSPGG